MSADLRSTVIDIGFPYVGRRTAHSTRRPNRDVVQVGRDTKAALLGARIARLYRFRAAAPAKCWAGRSVVMGDWRPREPNFAIWSGAYLRLREQAGCQA